MHPSWMWCHNSTLPDQENDQLSGGSVFYTELYPAIKNGEYCRRSTGKWLRPESMWECRWSLWQEQQVVCHPGRFEAWPLGHIGFPPGHPQAQQRCHCLFGNHFPCIGAYLGPTTNTFPTEGAKIGLLVNGSKWRIKQGLCRQSRDGCLRSMRDQILPVVGWVEINDGTVTLPA